MPLVPSKDVVVPGTVIKDLLKTQAQSLPERSFPTPHRRYCQDGKKTVQKNESLHTWGYPAAIGRVSWKPWKQSESEDMDCVPGVGA